MSCQSLTSLMPSPTWGDSRRHATTCGSRSRACWRSRRQHWPSPNCRPQRASALQQPAWRTVLGELRRHADVVDVVVIEAPPVLASADTGPLADLAEMILLVTDARRSTRAQVRTAMIELDAVHGELIGCVLHNVGRRRRLPRLPGRAAYGRARDPCHRRLRRLTAMSAPRGSVTALA
jgi:hypothetical protein